MLTDVQNSGNRNVIKKEAQEIIKYKDFTKDIQRMCKCKKTKVIPVIRGATGTTSKPFKKYLSNILGKHEIKEM